MRSARQDQNEAPTTEFDGLKDHHARVSANSLFTLHSSSPGSPLFQPSGTHVLQKLQDFLRAQYPSYGFQEVLTPTIYKKGLWEISGHWDNYKDDMFAVIGRGAQGGHDPGRQIGENEEYGLKPMNCPGHCLLFKSQKRSYKDLPIRYADFSPLHRNELSGALSGLTRLRRFHQDDGHIFCGHDQIKQEISKTLEFVHLVYQTLGLGAYKLRLGTRPQQYVGLVEEWDLAEICLMQALDESSRVYETIPGDGAFYGPKIDILLTDADGKDHQTATIQLDFQLPKRFALEYDTSASNKKHTPVLIHRAIVGSLERFTALLLQSYSGRLPFWISPYQMIVLTVGEKIQVRQRADSMARQLAFPDTRPGAQILKARKFMVDCDNSNQSLGKKILDARKKGYVFYAVVGERNLEQPPDKQTLDVTLSSHPYDEEVREVIDQFNQSQVRTRQNKNHASKISNQIVATSLTVQQCQELMTEIDSKFL
ncbi:MAG: hypothetical protein L6R41_003700 [Letrouitia leprolyta]|nr:MAG: hypothetical protein L6R41_003700 [Letrouitia leprolyta]